MAAQTKRKSRRRADPNQLSLLDYTPPVKAAPPSATTKASRHVVFQADRDAAPMPNVLTPKQAAAYLNLSLATLKSWRAKKTGPAFVKRGARLVGYKPADLDAYMSGK
jgi:hypothetical protein